MTRWAGFDVLLNLQSIVKFHWWTFTCREAGRAKTEGCDLFVKRKCLSEEIVADLRMLCFWDDREWSDKEKTSHEWLTVEVWRTAVWPHLRIHSRRLLVAHSRSSISESHLCKIIECHATSGIRTFKRFSKSHIAFGAKWRTARTDWRKRDRKGCQRIPLEITASPSHSNRSGVWFLIWFCFGTSQKTIKLLHPQQQKRTCYQSREVFYLSPRRFPLLDVHRRKWRREGERRRGILLNFKNRFQD